MEAREEKKKSLTVDFLEKISKKAIGLKYNIEAESVTYENIHIEVHNSVSQILRLIIKELT